MNSVQHFIFFTRALSFGNLAMFSQIKLCLIQSCVLVLSLMSHGRHAGKMTSLCFQRYLNILLARVVRCTCNQTHQLCHRCWSTPVRHCTCQSHESAATLIDIRPPRLNNDTVVNTKICLFVAYICCKVCNQVEFRAWI